MGSTEPLASILMDLAELGRKLVETSESALALLAQREAECRSPEPDPAAKDSMSIDKPMLMTGAQVAEELQVTLRTLRRMRAAGEGPKPIEVRGALRWRRVAVERWVARRES